MRIKFKRIEIRNFLSYKEETFDFDEHKGINLIYGRNLDIPESKNGVGKSSLGFALVYGLYGRLPFIKNKVKNENISNRYVDDKNVSITLHFSVDSRKYKTFVGLKRGKNSFFELYEITKDGKEDNLTKSTIDDTKEFVANEILHCDMNLFMRTILLNTDPEYNFYNLGKQEKQDFIDRLFDTKIYGDMHSIIHSDIMALSKEILAHQNKMMILNQNDENYAKLNEEFTVSHDNTVKTMKEEYESAKSKYDNGVKNAAKKNTELINELRDKLNALVSEREKVSAEIQNGRYEKQITLNKIKTLKAMIKDKRGIIGKHKTILSKVCDDCRGVVAKHYNLLSYQNDISKSEKEISNLENISKTFPDAEKELIDRLTTLNSEISAIESSIDNQNREYDKSISHLRDLQNSMNYAKSRLEDETVRKNPYVDLIENNRRSMNDESKILSDLKEDYKYKKYAEDIVDQENLKKSIIRELILLLNNRIKSYLDRLGTSFEIVFDEDMNYDFITNTNSHPDFNNFSSGERARISFATCFAFKDFLSNRSGISSNILILDEFIDGNVDSMAIDNIMEIVKEYSIKNRQNIYIVSHRKELDENMFDNKIGVVKKDHISKIFVN